MRRSAVSSMSAGLLLAVAAAVVLDHVEASYVVTFPCVVHPGMATRVAVSLLQPSTQPTVVITSLVTLEPTNVVSEQRTVLMADRHATIEVDVPAKLAGQRVVTLKVSAVGGVPFSNSSVVSVSKSRSLFIQTDKGQYKAGQTVQLRVVAVNLSLMPYAGRINVAVQDAKRNKIMEWSNASLVSGLWSESLPLSAQPVLGTWRIRVTEHGMDYSGQEDASFDVSEYVLPKFEVTVALPSHISVGDFTSVVVSATARYTHGQPLRGTVNMQLSLDSAAAPYMPNPCQQPDGAYRRYPGGYQAPPTKAQIVSNVFVLDGSGEATFTMSRDDFNRQFLCPGIGNLIDYYRVVANASVMDDVTGEIRWAVASAQLHRSSVRIHFDEDVTRRYFIPGSSYPVRALVTDIVGQPRYDGKAVRFIVETMVKNGSRDEDIRTLKPRGGVIVTAIDVEPDVEYMSLKADLGQDARAIFTPQRLVSPTGNYVTLSSQRASYAAGDTATVSANATVPVTSFVFAVLARQRLLVYQEVKPSLAAMSEASFSFSVDASMSPGMRVLCFYTSGGEMIVDALTLSATDMFRNNVSVAFDTSSSEPGNSVNLLVQAASGSTVAVGVVDRSTRLLDEGNSITVDKVKEEIAAYNTPTGRAPQIRYRRSKRLSLPFSRRRPYSAGTSAKDILDGAGVCVLSDLNIPGSPQVMYGRQMAGGGAAMKAGGGQAVEAVAFNAPAPVQTGKDVVSLVEPERVRTHFPETWIWMTAVAGGDGIARVSGVVPDSITTWEAGAFALSSTHGLGVAPRSASMKSSKPFFLSLNLPYSVIEGEELMLQVSLFNYVHANDAIIELKTSDDLVVVGTAAGDLATRNVSYMHTQEEVSSVQFLVIPRKSGALTVDVTAKSSLAADRVRRELLVESKGVQHSYSSGSLLDLITKGTLTQSLSLELPRDFVPGSVRARVSLIGDLMGPALSNLDELLKMPSGCGEQNMLNFAPDVFIMKYLTATERNTSDIADKATLYMRQGYQRELTYRRSDYSFSAFGERDDNGSLWLTAFVVKSFVQARPFIFVDVETLSRSVSYLIRQQGSDGSFPLVGMVHHSGMKGGLQGDVARTAYVLTTLVEAERVTWDKLQAAPAIVRTAKTRAQGYLESQLESISDNYTLALTAYALGLSKSRLAGRAVELLVARADTGSGIMWWTDSRATQSSSKHASRGFMSTAGRANAADIELTAYGLLAVLRAKDLVKSAWLARWLSAQRNSRGGFGSTQDTVVGLQALSELAAVMSSAEQKLTVTLESGAAAKYRRSLEVTASNSDVLQLVHDVPVPGNLTVKATGTGYALLSAEVFYNMPAGDAAPTYEMSAECSLEPYRTGLSAICQFCTAVAADAEPETVDGMSLLEVTIPSGFEGDVDALRQATADHELVKRVESSDRRLVLYLDEVPRTKLCVTAHLRQVRRVSNVQAVAMRTVNYYRPSVASALLYDVATVESCREAHVAHCPVVSSLDDRRSRATALQCSVTVAGMLVAALAAILLV